MSTNQKWHSTSFFTDEEDDMEQIYAEMFERCKNGHDSAEDYRDLPKNMKNELAQIELDGSEPYSGDESDSANDGEAGKDSRVEAADIDEDRVDELEEVELDGFDEDSEGYIDSETYGEAIKINDADSDVSRESFVDVLAEPQLDDFNNDSEDYLNSATPDEATNASDTHSDQSCSSSTNDLAHLQLDGFSSNNKEEPESARPDEAIKPPYPGSGYIYSSQRALYPYCGRDNSRHVDFQDWALQYADECGFGRSRLRCELLLNAHEEEALVIRLSNERRNVRVTHVGGWDQQRARTSIYPVLRPYQAFVPVDRDGVARMKTGRPETSKYGHYCPMCEMPIFAVPLEQIRTHMTECYHDIMEQNRDWEKKKGRKRGRGVDEEELGGRSREQRACIICLQDISGLEAQMIKEHLEDCMSDEDALEKCSQCQFDFTACESMEEVVGHLYECQTVTNRPCTEEQKPAAQKAELKEDATDKDILIALFEAAKATPRTRYDSAVTLAALDADGCPDPLIVSAEYICGSYPGEDSRSPSPDGTGMASDDEDNVRYPSSTTSVHEDEANKEGEEEPNKEGGLSEAGEDIKGLDGFHSAPEGTSSSVQDMVANKTPTAEKEAGPGFPCGLPDPPTTRLTNFPMQWARPLPAITRAARLPSVAGVEANKAGDGQAEAAEFTEQWAFVHLREAIKTDYVKYGQWHAGSKKYMALASASYEGDGMEHA